MILHQPDSDEFDTPILLPSLLDMISFDKEHRVETGDRWCTPFDHYGFTASAFAVESATNRSVPITLAVGNAGPGDLSDFTTRCQTIPTRTVFTYDVGIGPATVEVESYTTFAEVKRTARARALTLSMFAINWVLALFSVAVAMSLVLKKNVKEGFAFLPVTIILSIPGVRSLYVGSPPFGIFLGTHETAPHPFQAFTLPFRYSRVLPTNVNRSGVCYSIGTVSSHPRRKSHLQEKGGLAGGPSLVAPFIVRSSSTSWFFSFIEPPPMLDI